MKKSILFFLSLIACFCSAMAQNTSQPTVNSETQLVSPESEEVLTKENISPLKPIDCKAFAYASSEELNLAKDTQSEIIKAEILKNWEDKKRVQQLREDLWRLEHAIIVYK